MKLIGSTTSPFVRRLRLYLAEHNYEFINLDIFSPEDRQFLTENNPANKVPALIDGEQHIYDSRVIYRYLANKLGQTALSWPQENLLTLIDAANDSLVTILLSKRSGLDVEQDVLFFNLQHERLATVFNVLANEAANGEFTQWHYPSICLFCLLDWAQFRQLYDFSALPALVEFYQQAKSQLGIKETDPR